MFKGSGILRLVADDSGPQCGSVLGAVYALSPHSGAFPGGFGKLTYRFYFATCHDGLLRGQI